jgi:hypothetical protein
LPAAPISIAVPVHDDAPLLEGVLAGILGQTLAPREVILVDDCSADDSWELLQAWHARHPGLIRIVRNERHLGAAGNARKAFELTVEPLVHLHDAQDLLLADCLETWSGLLEAHPDAGLAASRAAQFRLAPATWQYLTDRWVPEAGYHGPETVAGELRSRLFSTGQVLYRRELFEEAGGYRLGHRGLSSWFHLHATAFRHGIAFSPKVLALSRPGSSSFGLPGLGPERLRALAGALLALLEEPGNADLLPRFARSGVLHHLGIPLAELVLDSPRWWTPAVLLMAQPNLHSWARQNDRVRLDRFRPVDPIATAEELEIRVAEALFACQHCGFRRVAIYGAGGMTESLLPLWRRQEGPEVVAIFTTDEQGSRELAGHRLGTLAGFDPACADAVILSSRDFELEMSEALQARFPAMPRIGLWHPALTTRLP